MSFFCDVHNHLLPGVDDGSMGMEETLRYLRDFRNQGVTEVVLTPHLLVADLGYREMEACLARHRDHFLGLIGKTQNAFTFPNLRLGQEILARGPVDIARVVGRADVGLAGGETLLVDLGLDGDFDAEGVIHCVVAEGRKIVVAHPERYRYPKGEFLSTVKKWKNLGAIIQVNGGSLMGLYPDPSKDQARMLLKEGLCDLVASDHHGDNRPHSTSMTVAAIVEVAGWSAVDFLMNTGPWKALGALTRSRPPDLRPSRSRAGNAA
jgi:protein-tyrosine phosphatase